MSQNAENELLRAARAVTTSVAVRGRPELRVLRVLGDDRESWLNGQVTADVRGLGQGASVHALAVNVRGKILAELWVAQGDAESFLVLVPERALAPLRESFERFIIMEDVELRTEDDLRVFSLLGPRASELARSLPLASFAGDELGTGGSFVLASEGDGPLRAQLERAASAVGGALLDEAAYELARLRRAVPRFGVDFDDAHYPQEAGLKHAVSFQKGCYLGQEVVCTLENRGRLTRRLCLLEASEGAQLTAGDTLTDDAGELRGTVTSFVRDPERGCTLAFGYVKRAQAVPGAQLLAGSTPLRVERVVGEAG